MKISFQTYIPAALIGSAMVLFTSVSFAGSGFDHNAEVTLPTGERAFVNINPAIKMAPAYGDRSKGLHGSFGQFPANFETPVHTHSGAYHGVVIKGVMTNPFVGEASPAKMDAGSYWFVPANAAHSTACVSDTPCEFYFHADSGFDFHVKE